MAANQFGIDLGDLYRTTEAVKGARTQNRLSQLQLDETEREIAERPAKEAAATERKNLLTGLRQKAVGGDVSAQQQLLALDPEGGATFIDAVTKMDDRKLKATQRSVDEMGQLAGYVLQGKTPEEQARRYQLMYQGVSPEVQSKLPEAYDPQFMELSLSKAMAMDKLLENPKAIQVGGEDVVYKAGREVERKTRPVKTSGTGSDGGGIKSADESLMYRQSVELLGGLFDQAGNITNLDPTVRNKVQGIATEATNIFREGGVTRSQAVKQAAQKFGLEVPDAGSTVDNDPLGIR
ncbi:hypothetical protein PODOV050v2_p0012 [Vibrio phage 66E30.1]|nr:hypothetical protein PODOV001v2_p0012 [Vibrio phage 41E34.2]QZI91240.1 hypothetical protein PODOV053v2_p0012 [Vibrio phage 24E30.2]QZI91280.1 hypothetical protein PODOV052v2_p0012 [Vibrio phage 24E35.2]QZI91443.1 hypothetical protein PODOV048v2_p0012 [Vibrio phage 34E29.1]QZI91480.1 hypothetical protein PODOV007v2_p0012 [Vibrio phage 36E38.1]QZI91749.1 hypothetical protein PODOV008v2_p0012 [Vibrio phage 44E38.1]QZI91786.1 hypothetical protein PODOV046v2_p0012 [Vibrio phage 44E38.2]QZI9197